MTWCLGLAGGYFHDAAAALFHDGKLVSFIEEERLTRVRYGTGQRPRACVRACLEEAGIALHDVDVLALAWNPYYPTDAATLEPDDPFLRELLPVEEFGKLMARIHVIDHQRSHAASAFRASGLPSALVVSVDGSGDGRSAAVFRGENGRLEELHAKNITQSLGWFYQRVTTYLGIGSWQNAGKTMALAAFGEPAYTFDFFELDAHEGFRFGHAHGIPQAELLHPSQAVRSAYYARHKQFLYDYFRRLGVPPQEGLPGVERVSGDRVYRQPSQLAANLAASAQRVIEDALVTLVAGHLAREGLDAVCIAGGVATNCKAMGELLVRVPGLRRLYVPPTTGDMGGALGAALEALYVEGITAGFPLDHAYWGIGFEDREIQRYLRDLGQPFETVADPAEAAADLVCKGQVVGWFQGRMEVGPRALGNRSIVAAPVAEATRNFINTRVKNREPWRPFSPSVLKGDYLAQTWESAANASPFMSIALHETGRVCPLPAVRHVDGTSRVQCVDRDCNPRYHALIEAVGQQNGVPAVLNTSLNARDEPIAMRPGDALRLFATTPLNAMVMGNTLIRKARF